MKSELMFIKILFNVVVAILVTKSCRTLCSPMDCSTPGFSVHGTSQARIVDWLAISFSKGSSQPRDPIQDSCIAGGSLLTSHQRSP